ncbi:hypothetical protein MA16_Dca028353 [Dendrobium catenatum]|uniref:Retrotransposon gag domain-containing protein n=1 Tax=Dendrobium catenatum TaxID=906689 RepID=A0A2I0VCH6_9ASPA|nr:hypothetical protein MA16_Dca028353 [Dendrobium catenatum]
MEKKIEEMMATMASFQSQGPLPPRAQVESSQPEPVQVIGKKQVVEAIEEHQQDPEVKASQSKEIKQMVEKQVREALAESQSSSYTPKGRPYPEEFDAVPYPKGFVPPSFKIFDGTGNPRQHIAYFRASCCNAGGSDALLFRQFVSSLSGVAFDWYVDLSNGSVHSFTELENMFVKRFAGSQHHVTVGDLVIDK